MNCLQPKNIKCIISDLDGTLIDSKIANYKAYKDAFSIIDFDLSKDIFCKFFGLNFEKFVTCILPNISPSEKKIIRENKDLFYLKYMDEIRVNCVLINFLKSLRNKKICLATSASRKNVNIIIDYYDLKNLFDLIVTADDVIKTKPDPECFLNIMNFFSVEPYETIIFEDSQIGIQAALASNANLISVDDW